MVRTTTLLAAVALVCSACADGGDTCTDTYADGVNHSFSGTSCDDKKPTPEVAALPSPEEIAADLAKSCTETYAFGCNPDGTNCHEEHVRECPGGVEEKTIEPGCRKVAPLSGTYDFVVGGTTGRDAFNNSFDGDFPFQAAIAIFNGLFQDGAGVPLHFALRTSNNSPTNGNSSFGTPHIANFQFLLKGVNSRFPTAAGLTTCGDSDLFGHTNCTVELVAENIRISSELTGHGQAAIAIATALHELGHVSCIQHFNVNSNELHFGPVFTAMNSFLLTDAVNDIGLYETYDPSEIDDARQAFALGQIPADPNTVFRGGFNQD